MAGVVEDVYEYLLQLISVTDDLGQVRIELFDQLNAVVGQVIGTE